MSNSSCAPEEISDVETERLRNRLLVMRAMEGDMEAFDSLFRLYHSRLLYYARRLLNNPDSADDVMQETWLQIFKSLPKLRSPEAFVVWSHTITRNLSAQHIRGLKRIPEKIDLFPDVANENEAGFLRLESAELVNKALGYLTPLHREVIVLRYLEEFSYEEISEITGVTIGTIKSRLHYAKDSMLVALRKLDNAR